MRSVSSAAWSCVGLFLCVAVPLCLTNYDHGRAFADQSVYHYPTILHFVHGGGFGDYPSATTPGYHLLLAAFARWITLSEPALKLANSVLTAALLGLVAGVVAKQVRSVVLSLALVLPMVFSIYVFPSGVWLLPDNLAWLTVFALFYLAANFEASARWYFAAALLLVAAVMVRQSNLWLCAIVLVAAARGGRIVPAALATVPAIAVLVYFVTLWHGLTPPSFAQKHTAANFAAVPFFFCVLGFYSVFYVPLVIAQVRTVWRPVIYLGGLAGLLASLIVPTDWDPDAGRVSGLWNVAKILPTVAHRSMFITGLATIGGALAVIWLLLAKPATRPILVAAAAGFMAAQLTSHFVYERYYAGMIFLLILQVTAEVLGRDSVQPVPRWSWTGPLAFTIVNAGILGAGLYAS